MIRELNDINMISHQLTELIQIAVSAKRFNNLLKDAITNNDAACYVYESDDKFIGILTIHFRDNKCEITSLAVDETYQGRGIGKKLTDYIKDKYNYIVAETDDDAIAFYRKQGFIIAPLGEKYPGINRYRCTFIRE